MDNVVLKTTTPSDPAKSTKSTTMVDNRPPPKAPAPTSAPCMRARRSVPDEWNMTSSSESEGEAEDADAAAAAQAPAQAALVMELNTEPEDLPKGTPRSKRQPKPSQRAKDAAAAQQSGDSSGFDELPQAESEPEVNTTERQGKKSSLRPGRIVRKRRARSIGAGVADTDDEADHGTVANSTGTPTPTQTLSRATGTKSPGPVRSPRRKKRKLLTPKTYERKGPEGIPIGMHVKYPGKLPVKARYYSNNALVCRVLIEDVEDEDVKRAMAKLFTDRGLTRVEDIRFDEGIFGPDARDMHTWPVPMAKARIRRYLTEQNIFPPTRNGVHATEGAATVSRGSSPDPSSLSDLESLTTPEIWADTSVEHLHEPYEWPEENDLHVGCHEAYDDLRVFAYLEEYQLSNTSSEWRVNFRVHNDDIDGMRPHDQAQLRSMWAPDWLDRPDVKFLPQYCHEHQAEADAKLHGELMNLLLAAINEAADSSSEVMSDEDRVAVACGRPVHPRTYGRKPRTDRGRPTSQSLRTAIEEFGLIASLQEQISRLEAEARNAQVQHSAIEAQLTADLETLRTQLKDSIPKAAHLEREKTITSLTQTKRDLEARLRHESRPSTQVETELRNEVAHLRSLSSSRAKDLQSARKDTEDAKEALVVATREGEEARMQLRQFQLVTVKTDSATKSDQLGALRLELAQTKDQSGQQAKDLAAARAEIALGKEHTAKELDTIRAKLVDAESLLATSRYATDKACQQAGALMKELDSARQEIAKVKSKTTNGSQSKELETIEKTGLVQSVASIAPSERGKKDTNDSSATNSKASKPPDYTISYLRQRVATASAELDRVRQEIQVIALQKPLAPKTTQGTTDQLTMSKRECDEVRTRISEMLAELVRKCREEEAWKAQLDRALHDSDGSWYSTMEKWKSVQKLCDDIKCGWFGAAPASKDITQQALSEREALTLGTGSDEDFRRALEHATLAFFDTIGRYITLIRRQEATHKAAVEKLKNSLRVKAVPKIVTMSKGTQADATTSPPPSDDFMPVAPIARPSSTASTSPSAISPSPAYPATITINDIPYDLKTSGPNGGKYIERRPRIVTACGREWIENRVLQRVGMHCEGSRLLREQRVTLEAGRCFRVIGEGEQKGRRVECLSGRGDFVVVVDGQEFVALCVRQEAAPLQL